MNEMKNVTVETKMQHILTNQKVCLIEKNEQTNKYRLTRDSMNRNNQEKDPIKTRKGQKNTWGTQEGNQVTNKTDN